MKPFFLSPVVALLIAVAASAETDPLQLLRDAAATTAAADSASVEFVVTTKLVRNDETNEMSGAFTYKTAPGGRFEFVSVPTEEGPDAGFHIAGNGSVTLTAMLSSRRHMLEPDADGFAAFVRSPAAAGIGSGLGGLALAFVHPESAEDLTESITESEYVGQEEVDGETLVHVRYTVQGGVQNDVWFTSGDQPLVRRIRPNVRDTPGVQEMARRYDTFDYQLVFDFNNWDTEAALTAEDLPVREPSGSLLVASLYKRAEEQPHKLLGEKAPALTLTNPAGEEVDLTQTVGKDVTLLEFWSINCPYCIKAMPEMEKLHEQYAERGLQYYAVNVGDEATTVAAFLDSKGFDAETILLDPELELAQAYEVGPIPLILLIGKDGKVQSATEGFSPRVKATLEGRIEAALEGEDVAGVELAAWKEKNEARMAERKRLRSLLDS